MQSQDDYQDYDYEYEPQPARRSNRALWIVGIAIIAAGVIYQNWWGAIGAIPLLTALIGWCPPYAMLGISTCKQKEA